jgi:hypothetical protein
LYNRQIARRDPAAGAGTLPLRRSVQGRIRNLPGSFCARIHTRSSAVSLQRRAVAKAVCYPQQADDCAIHSDPARGEAANRVQQNRVSGAK